MVALSNKTVRIVGLARNVQSNLAAEVVRLRRIFNSIYEEVEFFVVESDSSDETLSVLKKLSSEVPDFYYFTYGRLELELPNRIDRLIHCRNRYVQWLREQSVPASVVVVDFDIRNTKLSSNHVRQALSDLDFADGIFANQSGRYFDIYALRCAGWSNSDCFVEYRELMKSMQPKKAKQKVIWSKMRKIGPKNYPIQVDSAFGGLAIYKNLVFQNYDYTSNEGITQESEHVYLHRKLKADGLRLYIHPRLTNFGWNSHNLSSFRFFRLVDHLTDTPKFKRIRRLLRDAVM